MRTIAEFLIQLLQSDRICLTFSNLGKFRMNKATGKYTKVGYLCV